VRYLLLFFPFLFQNLLSDDSITQQNHNPFTFVSLNDPFLAFPGGRYTRRAGGLQTEKTYPFESIAGAEPSCTARADHFVVTAADTTDQQSVYKKAASYAISRESARITELAMAYHVAYVGPLVVCIDATKLSTYTGGVMSQCGIEVNRKYILPASVSLIV
jgi:hypothetical protein